MNGGGRQLLRMLTLSAGAVAAVAGFACVADQPSDPPRPSPPPVVVPPIAEVSPLLTPVRVSPDGDFIAIGFPPATVVDLDSGDLVDDVAAARANVVDDAALWVEGYLDPRSDAVVVYNVDSGVISEHGTAVAVQQDKQRVWAQRGPSGPYDTIAMSDLVEVRVADVGEDLRVHPDYTTLVMDGAFTIVAPRHIVLSESFPEPGREVAFPPQLLVSFSRVHHVNLDTGVVFERSSATDLIATGEIVFDVEATDEIVAEGPDGVSRLLCHTNGPFFLSDQFFACQAYERTRYSVFETRSGVKLESSDSGFQIRDNGYATNGRDVVHLHFADGRNTVPYGVVDRFNAVGTAATIRRPRGSDLVVARGSQPFERANSKDELTIDLHRAFGVVRGGVGGPRIVDLGDLSETPTDVLLQAVAVTTSDELWTIEGRAGESRPLLRAYRAGRERVDVMAGVDRILFADRGLAVVAVSDAVDDDENGVFVVLLDP